MNINKANKLNRYTISRQEERLCSMKKLFQVTLALMLCVSAVFAQDDLGERVDGLQARVDGVLSKAGIHFGGEFRSQFLNSEVSGDAVADNQKKSESAEFTSVDFDIVARPNTVLGARAVFRLHQDWRNFFSDVQNPIVTRWLSIDGQVGGMLEYHAGDYLKKISPLTLWDHGFELLYEPEIFAADRRLAMAEAFVGDSKKLLQGFDIAFKAELFPILKEVGANAFGARLATRGTIESMVASNPADYDKYLLGFDIGSQIIEGAGFAVSDIYIYDYLASFQGTEDAAKLNKPQETNVLTGRVNFDTRVFMDGGTFLAGLDAEAAYSSDKRWKSVDKDTSVTGMAINAGLSLRVALNEENNVKLKAVYVMNDETFRNDAAQTPDFMQRQIMNKENVLSSLGVMNPFDAMYRTVFKYVPPQYPKSGQPFAAQPYTKNAYNNVILSPEVIEGYAKDTSFRFPNIFQTAGNEATANRVGPVVKFDGSFLDDALTVGARVTMFNAKEELKLDYNLGPNPNDPEAPQIVGTIPVTPEFLTAGGGASVDIAKFVPVLGPSLKIGGSFMMYNAMTAAVVPSIGVLENVVKSNNESQLISAELVYNFAPRFSILAGYQMLNTTIKREINGAADPVAAPDQEYKFDNLGIGFGYKVADGGNLTVKLTMLTGEGPVGGETKSYTAMQPEVFLTVKF